MELCADGRLAAALLTYLESTERGVEPALDTLPGDPPDLAAELREFVDTHRYLERLTAPVRQAVRAANHAPVRQTTAYGYERRRSGSDRSG